MAQRPDASGFRFDTQLSVSIFLALVLKICRNRFSCHGPSVAELDPSKLSNFGHSLTIYGLPRRGGGAAQDQPLKKQTMFAQGDSSDAVFYIKEGKLEPTVVSQIGKEATIGILNKGDFFGEGCLTGQPLRLCSATAMTDCSVMKIDKKSMNEVLHREHAFPDMFVGYLLTRNIRHEEDLVDQLFNSSEKRLAWILLLLAHSGKEGVPETVIPKIESRDPRRDDRHTPLAGELFHEQV
jgi:hypothetical protein